jgi:GDP-L-fucose synthase
MKKILVTGAEGFIGKNLVNYLKNSSYEVLYPTQDQLDLADSVAVKFFFNNNNNIDCIVHCATGQVIDKIYEPNVCEINLKMFFNLLNYRKNDSKLINLGSGSEYSRDHWIPKMHENYFGKFIPYDAHSFSKYVISKYILETKKSNLYHLRIFGLFGKYEDYRYKFISNSIVKKIFNIPITVNKNVIYDYVFIDDFCKIVDFFINNDSANNDFNITSGQPFDLLSIIYIIDKFFGEKTKLKILKEGFGNEYTGDNSRLINFISDLKFSNIEESIKSLAEYYISIKNKIDVNSLVDDKFLEYAKQINP